MKRLICADLKRIVAKPGMYVIVTLMALYAILMDSADTPSDQIRLYETVFGTVGLILVGIPIYLAVYADEFKSGIMISMIGMGMARRKLIIAKLCDCLILYLGTYFILLMAAWLCNSLSGLPITPRQNVFLLVYCLFCVIRGIGVMALASLVLFLTMSTAGGMFVLILAAAVGAGFLRVIQNYTSLPVYDLSFMGLLDSSYVAFQNGEFGFSLIVALLYLFAVIAVTVRIYERKEMDL